MRSPQVPLDRPGGGRESSCRQQRGRFDVEDRDPQGFGDGVPEGAENAQADHRVRVLTRRVKVLQHFPDDRGNQGADGANRFEGVGAAGLHELLPRVARHNPLDIPAQGVEADAVFLDETGEVFGGGQAYLIPGLLQPPAEDDTRLDIPS